MGLYINQDNHTDIFKNNTVINEPNQGIFIRNHMAEMIEEQQKVNQALHRSFHGLKNLQEQQGIVQTGRWQEVGGRLNELKEMNLQQEKLEGQVLERLQKLENENVSEQEFMEQINRMRQSQQAVENQLETYGLSNEQLSVKMDEQTALQKQMVEEISNQENSNEEVLSRLENQEALMEKVVRQLDHFRSILFERTNFLAEKMEDGYHLTSSYVNQLMSGSDQPMTFFMTNRKQEKDSD
ncbi:hypothetical protein J2Z83_002306 [Virgibacillus natechei]|uniref:Uncharacterized protein n=1 Tax=Virgibacillus natechei TaxID=1216297 RepID=A0ABS4IGX0_9BACI|nr:hypothetical protein [Virgibacillus natechei]MBP1970188.1 hypothetical protein [Virgibacillus natechei]UZD12860.1 hypothetical protein OLD84_18560 [Virgibacillus natechei]